MSNQQHHPQMSQAAAEAIGSRPDPLTAWKSVPDAVRFAVWVWAFGVILSAVAAVLLGVAFLVGVAVGS